MRGRKPKPTHLKLVTGNPGKRPLNTREPRRATGRPMPPAHLTAEARTEWRRVIKLLHAVGAITTLDRAVLAVYCQAWARMVQAERALAAMAEQDPVTGALLVKTKSGNLIQNPLVGIANTAANIMNKACVEIGMTPSASTRIIGSTSGDRKTERPASKYY